MSRSKPFTPWLWLGGIAALLAVGLALVLATSQARAREEWALLLESMQMEDLESGGRWITRVTYGAPTSVQGRLRIWGERECVWEVQTWVTPEDGKGHIADAQFRLVLSQERRWFGRSLHASIHMKVNWNGSNSPILLAFLRALDEAGAEVSRVGW